MRITDEELHVMADYADSQSVRRISYGDGSHRYYGWRRAFAAAVAKDCARLIAEARTDDPGTALACADMIRERYGVE